jgi:hypothetical protein
VEGHPCGGENGQAAGGGRGFRAKIYRPVDPRPVTFLNQAAGTGNHAEKSLVCDYGFASIDIRITVALGKDYFAIFDYSHSGTGSVMCLEFSVNRSVHKRLKFLGTVGPPAETLLAFRDKPEMALMHTRHAIKTKTDPNRKALRIFIRWTSIDGLLAELSPFDLFIYCFNHNWVRE